MKIDSAPVLNEWYYQCPSSLMCFIYNNLSLILKLIQETQT